MCVPSPSFGALASTACTFLRSVVSGSATVGLALKNTTDRGCPGFRAAKARAAAIAESIDPFMLFDESIRSTVPMPSADAEESTLRSCTGLPFSVTLTSSAVSAEAGLLDSVRMYARSGKSAVPASTTCGPLASSAAAAGYAPIAARAATSARTSVRAGRVTGADPRRSS
jgi:hypothetical protein